MCKKKLAKDTKAIIIGSTIVFIVSLIIGLVLLSLPKYGLDAAIYPFIICGVIIISAPIAYCVDRYLELLYSDGEYY